MFLLLPLLISSQFLTHNQNDYVKMQTNYVTFSFKASSGSISLMIEERPFSDICVTCSTFVDLYSGVFS